MSSLACCPVIWVCEGNRAFLHQALSLSSATLLTNNHALQAATCSDSSAIRAEALRQTQWNDKHLWLALCSCPENWWLLSPGSGRTATDQGQLCPRSVPESARVCVVKGTVIQPASPVSGREQVSPPTPLSSPVPTCNSSLLPALLQIKPAHRHSRHAVGLSDWQCVRVALNLAAMRVTSSHTPLKRRSHNIYPFFIRCTFGAVSFSHLHRPSVLEKPVVQR